MLLSIHMAGNVFNIRGLRTFLWRAQGRIKKKVFECGTNQIFLRRQTNRVLSNLFFL